MAAASPRRLPSRVYWFRRGLVLVLALALVVGVAHLLGGGEETSRAQQATTAGSQTRPTPVAPELGPTAAVELRPRKARQAAPAEPTGECAPGDISAVPSVPSPAEVAGEEPTTEEAATQPAEAGSPVTLDIALQGTQAACTFEVGPRTIALKVTTEDDEPFWSSQTCPGQVPRETVVVRSAEPTVVSMSWSARDSRVGCGDQAVWALPGFYRVHATVQGSTPSDVPFELVRPGVVYVTETPKPRARERDAAPESQPAAPRPEASPTPSVTPTD